MLLFTQPIGTTIGVLITVASNVNTMITAIDTIIVTVIAHVTATVTSAGMTASREDPVPRLRKAVDDTPCARKLAPQDHRAPTRFVTAVTIRHWLTHPSIPGINNRGTY